MSYFTELKLIDKLTGVAAKINAVGQIHTVAPLQQAIEDGVAFRAWGQGNPDVVLVVTPDVDTRISIEADVEQETLFQVYETPDSVTGGAAFTPVNLNRASAETFAGDVVVGATVDVTTATLIDFKRLNAATRYQADMVLLAETEYVIRTVCQITGNNEVNIRLLLW